MDEMKVRVETTEETFSRLRSAARRIDAGDFDVREFGISFATPEQMFSVLSPGRWALLRRLKQPGPWSIRALAGSLGRDYKAVHTDVTVLIENGLIERDAAGKISVPWSRVSAEMGVEAA